MPDVLVPREAVPSLDTVEELVKSGLPASAERLTEAAANEDFYQLQNCKHLERRPAESESDFQARPKRYSRLLRCAIRKLGEPLYSPGPTRHYEGSAPVTKWLGQVYNDGYVNVRLQSADRACTLNHVAAVQVEATNDPRRPVRYWLWKGHEFEVFCRDGDPINPWAVCTIERIADGLGRFRTRYRLWSAYEWRTYLTKPWSHHDPSGGRRAERVYGPESGPSPYPGVLPFVFVRNEPAEADFWAGGIGSALREANEDLDRGLSNLAQHVEAFLNPFAWARGMPANARFWQRVGTFNHLVGITELDGTQRIVPEVGYLQGQLGVESAWFDVKTAADSALEELEVPLTVVRTNDPVDMSGVAIRAKAAPLVARTRARQLTFGETEQALAATTMAVAGAWYHGGAGAPALMAAAADPAGLVCVWPEPKVLDMESQEGLDLLVAEIAHGFTDPIEALARLRGITIEQAETLAVAIADRRKRWETLMGVTVGPEPADERTPEPEPDSDEKEPTDG